MSEKIVFFFVPKFSRVLERIRYLVKPFYDFFASIAVWLLPTKNKFGNWPMSGEIDLLESRGNLNYKPSNIEIGVQQVASTLHFGPNKTQDGYRTAHYPKNDINGFHSGFHSYEFIWNEKGIQFFIDKIQIGFAKVGDGFWKRGNFEGKNIWTEGILIEIISNEIHVSEQLFFQQVLKWPHLIKR